MKNDDDNDGEKQVPHATDKEEGEQQKTNQDDQDIESAAAALVADAADGVDDATTTTKAATTTTRTHSTATTASSASSSKGAAAAATATAATSPGVANAAEGGTAAVARRPEGAAAAADAPTPTNTELRRSRHRKWIRDRVDGKSRVEHPQRGDGSIDDRRPWVRPCLPPPCVAWCSPIFEHNWCCEKLGGCGFVDPDNERMRRRLMRIGLTSNIVGMALTIVSCFSISQSFPLLVGFAFSIGRVRPLITSENRYLNLQPIFLAIGLKAAAIYDPGLLSNYVINGDPRSDPKSVVPFNTFCDIPRQITAKYFAADACDNCNSVSSGIVASLFLSLITYLPSIFTNFTRMYHNYDVNCQKSFGIFSSMFSIAMSLNTILTYKNTCFGGLYDSAVSFTVRNGTVLEFDPNMNTTQGGDGPGVAVTYDFDWQGGAGYLCLLIATLLKLVDITVHWTLPTPDITRNHEKQQAYEQQNHQD